MEGDHWQTPMGSTGEQDLKASRGGRALASQCEAFIAHVASAPFRECQPLQARGELASGALEVPAGPGLPDDPTRLLLVPPGGRCYSMRGVSPA